MLPARDRVSDSDRQPSDVASADRPAEEDALRWPEHLQNAVATLDRCRKLFRMLSVAREPAELAQYLEFLTHRIEIVARAGAAAAGQAEPLTDASPDELQEWLNVGPIRIEEPLAGDPGAVAQSP